MSVFLTMSAIIPNHVKPVFYEPQPALAGTGTLPISNLLGGGLQSVFLVRELIREGKSPEQMENEVRLICVFKLCPIDFVSEALRIRMGKKFVSVSSERERRQPVCKLLHPADGKIVPKPFHC